MSPKSGTRLNLIFKRVIEASPKEIFDGWLDGSIPGSPWHKATRSSRTIEKNGLFYFMQRIDGREHPHYGRFMKVVRPTLVSMTWMSPHTRGLESVVTVSLKAAGAKTALVLRHDHLPNDEEGELHEGGWDYYLAELQKAFK